MSLTSPLGLMRHLRRPDLRLEMVPWLNVLAIGLMFTLLGGRFIYSPGIAFELQPGSASASIRLNPPVVPGGDLPGRPTDIVLTVASTNPPKFYFGGGINTLQTLREPLHNARAGLPQNRTPIMLFITSGDLPVETFLQVLDLARDAGFEVQVAAKDKSTATDVTTAGN